MISCFVCSVPLSAVCGYDVDHMVSFGGLVHFLFIIACFIFVFSRSSSGDAKGLLGTFSRCDHIDRVQVKGHGGVSSTFKIKPGFRPQVGPLVSKFSAHACIYTAGKLGLDVTSVPGSSLQLSYIKREMADINSATCTTAYKLLVPLQLSLYTKCLVPSLPEVQ